MGKGSFKANKGTRTTKAPGLVSADETAAQEVNDQQPSIGYTNVVGRQSTLEEALATPLEPLDSDEDEDKSVTTADGGTGEQAATDEATTTTGSKGGTKEEVMADEATLASNGDTGGMVTQKNRCA